ncbi:hypothetical protein R8Z50_22150 [Longispora sp. K20-0274]|uniref:hypothetical protein n=1 Tax=Longispora sp. K20-0274 TaxID=3088255 RepID=UPI00399A4F7C
MHNNRIMQWALRIITAAGLAVDAFVHLDLAAGFDANKATISQGTLFRVQGIAALIIAVAVLTLRRRWVYLLAFVVAASALGAVVLYRYVDVGALGPLPNMYEPAWYAEKRYSALAEAVAAAAALLLVGNPLRRRATTGSNHAD